MKLFQAHCVHSFSWLCKTRFVRKHSTTYLIISSRFCFSRFSFRGACFPDRRGTTAGIIKFLETFYLYTEYYEFLLSSGLDLRYKDPVAPVRIIFRAIFFTPLYPLSLFYPTLRSFFFLFLSLSLPLPFSSSSLLNLRTSLKARWPRAKKLVI